MLPEALLEIIFIIFVTSIYFYLKNTLPAYLKEKSKNLATKEDIEEITNKVESIKHNYNKQLEEFKQEQLIRYKSEVVAELIAEWLDRPEDNKRLNQLTFQAFLWLPDDICDDLSEILTHKTKDKTFRNIIQKTRLYLLKETNFDALKVVNFLKTFRDKGKEMKELEIEKIKIKIECGKCKSILIVQNMNTINNISPCPSCGEIYQYDSANNKIFESFDNLKKFIKIENNSTERKSKFSLVIDKEENNE